MSLASGARLGPYEILSALGAGGMGEVYKARDTRLDRTVALKILPAQLADDPQFRDRFEREAKAVAALTHPHICTLYDVGRQDGTEYLVMEFLEGETLAQRLEKGALPLDQALKTAIEIASALDKAHRAGIVHRDLKPGNIMLTKAGAKLLDFGLAKASAPIVAGVGLSMLPTTPPNLTAQGTILGTFQYMAPEQLEGQEADARTDIFAFGAVLYETLAGKKAFEGKSQASLIHAIMGVDPPPVSVLQPLAPSVLDRIVKKCLAKHADDRWQTARDLRDELSWVSERAEVRGLREPPSGTTRFANAHVAWASAAFCALLASGAAVALVVRSAPVSPAFPYRASLPVVGSLASNPAQRLALSPDGRRLAFVAADGSGHLALWVRTLDTAVEQRLAGTEDATGPSWSPDGRELAFFSGNTLRKVDAAGGRPVTICDAAGGAGPVTWGPSGIILFPSADGLISRVSVDGRMVSAVTSLDTQAGERRHGFPYFLPDGRHFLYLALAAGNSPLGVYVASLDSHERKRVLETGTNAKYVNGVLLYLRQATLVAQRFDLDRLVLDGDAVPISSDTVFLGNPTRTGAFTVSNGVLAYQPGRPSDAQLVWYDRRGERIGVVGDRGDYADLHLSPDGRSASISIPESGGARDVWLVDVMRGLRQHFTIGSADEYSAVWSPDNTALIYTSDRKGNLDLYQRSVTSIGREEVLLADTAAKTPQNWSPDGRFVLYRRTDLSSARGRGALWVLPMVGERKPFPLLDTTFNEDFGQFSPDGRWIAYQSSESGQNEIYVVPFPGPGPKRQISNASGFQPRWRRDGTEIFFVTTGLKLMAASVSVKGSQLEVGSVTPLFDVHPHNQAQRYYDVAPDGQRFLVNADDDSDATASISLVINWPALLKK